MADLNIAISITGRDSGASAAAQSVSKSIDAIGSSAQRNVGIIGGLTTALGKIGLASMGIQAIGSAVTGLGGALGLGLASQLETTRARFMAFTKDADLTDRTLAELRTEADKTPFSFSAMATAASNLIPAAKAANLPLMEMIKTSEIMAALNPAEGLEGAAFSLRAATSGDFVSAMERFDIPRDIINRLKAEGVPNAQIIGRALQEMGVDISLVSNMAETGSGRWSTFMDTIDSLRLKLATPLFEGIKTGLMGLQGVFDANKEQLTAWATSIGEAIGNAFNALIRNLPAIIGFFVQLWGALQPLVAIFAAIGGALLQMASFFGQNQIAMDLLVGSVTALVGAYVLYQTAMTAVHTVTAIATVALNAWKAATIAAGVATKAFQIVMLALSLTMAVNPFVIIVLALVALVAALVFAYQHSETFRNIVNAAFAAVVAAGQALMAFFAGLGAWFGSVFVAIGAVVSTGVAALVVFFTGLWTGITAGVQAAMDAIMAVVSTVWNAIAGFIGGIIGVIAGIIAAGWSGLVGIVAAALGAIMDVVSSVWNAIIGVISGVMSAVESTVAGAWASIVGVVASAISAVLSAVSSGWSAISSVIAEVMATISSTVSSVWNAITAFVTSAVSSILSAITSAWSTIASATAEAWNRVVSVIREALSSAIEAVMRFGGEVISAISGFAGRVFDAATSIGRAIVDGIWQGIMNLKGELLGRIGDFVGGLVQAAKDAVSIGSPSKVFAEEVGKPIAQGIMAGMLGMRPDLDLAIGRLVSPRGMAPVAGGSSVTNARTYHVTINAPGTTLDEQGMARVLRRMEMLYG